MVGTSQKKIQLFIKQELPLLIEKGYVPPVTEFRNVTENSNGLVAQPGRALPYPIQADYSNEMKSLGGALIPGPLPYQGNTAAIAAAVVESPYRSTCNEVEVAGSNPAQGINWSDFKDYLEKTYNHNTAKVRLCYAKQFCSVLQNGDASDLLRWRASDEKKLNVMKSLTALSKYLGCYDRWQDMRRHYSLKWSMGNSIQSFQRFFNGELSLDKMIELIELIKEMTHKLPPLWAK